MFESMDEIFKCSHSNESYMYRVVLFNLLYNVILTFNSVDEILNYNYNGQYLLCAGH